MKVCASQFAKAAGPSAPAWLPRSSSKQCLQFGGPGRRRFAIREGGRTVGAGVVAKIVK
ncbi:hypothetical protein [Xanthomonas arboricola]|uniref:EF-Tu C-terminal domain-related protein n=1 Tax=Xanthomonas arboricola TaxID=56448 RepID=UPI00235319AE|nr:hypothetical protein [Xanthomonas arboricola]